MYIPIKKTPKLRRARGFKAVQNELWTLQLHHSQLGRAGEAFLGQARGETHPKAREAAGPRVLRCRLSSRCAEMSRKETVPNPQRSRSRCQREPPPVPGAPWGPATPEAQLEFQPKINRCHPRAPGSAFPAFCGFWDAQPSSRWRSLAGSGSAPQNPSHSRRQRRSIPGESPPFSRPCFAFQD